MSDSTIGDPMNGLDNDAQDSKAEPRRFDSAHKIVSDAFEHGDLGGVRNPNRKPNRVAAKAPTSRLMARRLVDEAKALELRKAAASYSQIGREMGISAGQAYQLVKGALERLARTTTEKAEEIRALELMRLDAIWLALSQQPQTTRVADALMRISKRRSEIAGTDVPERHIIQGDPKAPVGLTVVPAAFDPSRLTNEQLQQLRTLLEQSKPAEPTAALPEGSGK